MFILCFSKFVKGIGGLTISPPLIPAQTYNIDGKISVSPPAETAESRKSAENTEADILSDKKENYWGNTRGACCSKTRLKRLSKSEI